MTVLSEGEKFNSEIPSSKKLGSTGATTVLQFIYLGTG